MRLRHAALFAALSVVPFSSAHAKDELLETLAQKGVISMEEYEKLKAQRKTEVTVTTEDGFRLSSADGASTLQVGTLQQLDFAGYEDDKNDLSSGSELRRSRLSVGGSFLKDWQYRVEYEFAGTTGVTDAYVSYNALKPLVITAGQFKQPFGMEAISADKNATFMERGLPFAFVITRAPGLAVSSSGANWSLNAGLFGEPVGNAQAGDEGHALVARGTYAPLLDGNTVVHLGLGYTLRRPTAENFTNSAGDRLTSVRFRAKPESNILSQRLVDTGEITGVDEYSIGGVELAAQAGAFSLQGEYHAVTVDRESGSSLDFSGWYTQLAYTLTGEARPYKAERGVFDGIRPAKNFGKDGWGAFEVAARVSELDLSDKEIVGGRERNATAALNWYPNPLLRAGINVVKVLEVEGGAADGNEPTVYEMRLQLAL